MFGDVVKGRATSSKVESEAKKSEGLPAEKRMRDQVEKQ